jgi:DNA-directed RNA polymerase III subunit RPC11
MWFCPVDGTLMLVEARTGGGPGAESAHEAAAAAAAGAQPWYGSEGTCFYCPVCPYAYRLSQRRTVRVRTKRKDVDDVMGGAAALENVDKTEALCPSCSHREAFYMMIQTRSADEPMTCFYKCVSCGNRWADK